MDMWLEVVYLAIRRCCRASPSCAAVDFSTVYAKVEMAVLVVRFPYSFIYFEIKVQNKSK